jgi:hypothetical protein
MSQRLGYGPDVVGQVGSASSEVGGVQEWEGIDQDSSNCYGDEESCDNMAGSISSVTGESAAQRMRRSENRRFGGSATS